MREFVGVKSPLDLLIEVGSKRLPVESVFKREALMFRRIACPQLGQLVSAFEKLRGIAGALSDQFCAHVDFLKQQGVIFDDVSSASGPELGVLMSNSSFRNLTHVEWPIGQAIFEGLKNAGLEKVLEGQEITVDEMLPRLQQVPFIAGPLVCALQLIIRKLSIQLRELNGMDAYPIFSQIVPAVPFEDDQKCEVIEIVMKTLPLPDDNVSWEQIVNFRRDPDSQSKFLALRHWMSETARGELTPAEVEEKLEYLIDQYQQHMKLHRMKTNVGLLETVVVAATDLVSFKWGRAAQALFSVRRSRISLLEGELTSPGSEVAFIVSAREKFETTIDHGSIK